MNYYERRRRELQVTPAPRILRWAVRNVNQLARAQHQRLAARSRHLPGSDPVGHVDEKLKKRATQRRGGDYISNANFQAGGPLIANKMFYFASQKPADARQRGCSTASRRRRSSSKSGNDGTRPKSGALGQADYATTREPFREHGKTVVRKAEPRRWAPCNDGLEPKRTRHVSHLALSGKSVVSRRWSATPSFFATHTHFRWNRRR